MSLCNDRFIVRPASFGDASHTLLDLTPKNNILSSYQRHIRRACFDNGDLVGVFRQRALAADDMPTSRFDIKLQCMLEYPLGEHEKLHRYMFDSRRDILAVVCDDGNLHLTARDNFVDLPQSLAPLRFQSVAIAKQDSLIAVLDDSNGLHLLDNAAMHASQQIQTSAVLFGSPVLEWCRSRYTVAVGSGSHLRFYDLRAKELAQHCVFPGKIVQQVSANEHVDLFAVRHSDHSVAVYDHRNVSAPMYTHWCTASAMAWLPGSCSRLTVVDKKTSRLDVVNVSTRDTQLLAEQLYRPNSSSDNRVGTICDIHWLNNGGTQIVAIQKKREEIGDEPFVLNNFFCHKRNGDGATMMRHTASYDKIDYYGASVYNRQTRVLHVASENEVLSQLTVERKGEQQTKRKRLFRDIGISSSKLNKADIR